MYARRANVTPRRLHGVVAYAAIMAIVLAFVGRGGPSSPWMPLPLMFPVSLRRRFFERFLDGNAKRVREAPALVAAAESALVPEPRRRPRGLSGDDAETPGTLDRSIVASTAAAAKFGNDSVPPPAPEYAQDEGGRGRSMAELGEEDGGIRFSRLLEFRTREDLFLACRLRSPTHPKKQGRKAA
jgi:hypothetical protein